MSLTALQALLDDTGSICLIHSLTHSLGDEPCYYRPMACGYTSDPAQAGLYLRADAEARCRHLEHEIRPVPAGPILRQALAPLLAQVNVLASTKHLMVMDDDEGLERQAPPSEVVDAA
jgi:hypothetical protein